MTVINRPSETEIQRTIEKEKSKCTDAAYAAVDNLMRSWKSGIDGKEGLRSELVEACAVQVARYEDLAKDWINSYGSLENTGRGKTFKQNFVGGVVVAIQSHLAKRLFK